MLDKVYVFGHQNPDTDSICSSIAYANLKRKLGMQNATAYRLGNINKETAFVLDYFGIEEPPYLRNIKPKLKDLDLYEMPAEIRKDDPVQKAWDILKHQKGSRLVPILNEAGALDGILSNGDIISLFMELSDENIVKKYEIRFENLIKVLEGKIISGSYNFEKVEGAFYIGTTIPEESQLCEKDIVLTGKVENAFHLANATKCGCVILTNDRPTYNIQSSHAAIISVPHTMVKVVSLITQAVSVSSIMRSTGIISFSTDNYIDEIIDIMKTSAHRNFPVVDREGKLAGIISRRHLIEYRMKKVILIDHNEASQSAEGLDQAEILEIIDHHRVADIQTRSPLYIRAEPVGCTATIIAKMYRESSVEIDKPTAGMLLSAILSDTLMFTSPTCTLVDKQESKKLAEIAGVDMYTYSREMFETSTSLEGFTPSEILAIDRKRFSFDKYCAYISQVNTLDFKSAVKLKQGILDAMQQFYEESKCDLVILMITDIVLEGSEVIVLGNHQAKNVVENLFNIPRGEDSIYLSGVVSRKKQIIPKLAMASHLDM